MSVRTRQRFEWQSSGIARRSGVWYGPFPSFHSKREKAVDETNSGDNRQLDVETKAYSGGRISCNGPGTIGEPPLFDNFQADYYRNMIGSDGFVHHVVSGDKGDLAYATIAAARTNPSRPYVDVPVAALQLGELTTLIRDVGRSIIKNTANTNLALQFGLMPLVSDLWKLYNYREQVSRRVQEIERLHSGRGLRRTIALGGLDRLEVNASDPGGTVQTVYATCQSGPHTGQTVRSIGAHLRWKPTLTAPSNLSNDAMNALAKKAVLGLTVDASTVWELIPWSWMVDWGSTCGSFLAAHRNIIPAYPSEISITRRTSCHLRWAGWSAPFSWATIKVSPFDVRIERKQRTRHDNIVAPTAHWPFLSANQMGIVASLAVTRM